MSKGGIIMTEIHTNYVPVVRLHAVKERFLPYGVEGNINTPEKVVKMVNKLLKDADREHALAISVDAKSKPVGIEIVAVGSLNVAYIEPRELFKHAVLSNASGIILVHNHPSGDVTPSVEDWHFTYRVMEAGALLGVELLDHIITGDNEEFVSLSQTKEWKKEKG